MGNSTRYRDAPQKKSGGGSSGQKSRGAQPVTPGVKTRSAATRPGAWHTAAGGKSRSYRGK